MKNFRLGVTEYERGWGQRHEWYYFDTLEEAEKVKQEINSKNNLPSAPDYYEVAGEIQHIAPTWVNV